LTKVEGRGYGIACGFEKGSYIATAAEVSVDAKTGRVKIERVVESFECRAIVNKLHLHNQVEGALVQAIGGALFESIQFKDGQILNGKFRSIDCRGLVTCRRLRSCCSTAKICRQRAQAKRRLWDSRQRLGMRFLMRRV